MKNNAGSPPHSITIKEDAVNEYFAADDNAVIAFIKNKWTGEIYLSVTYLVDVLDIAGNFEDFLYSTEGLDLFNEWREAPPNSLLRKKYSDNTVDTRLLSDDDDIEF